MLATSPLDTASQKPDYWDWQAEDYNRELQRIKQARLNLSAQAAGLARTGDMGSLAALQNASQGLDAREAAVQARGSQQATTDADTLNRSWKMNPPPSWAGDAPRSQYMNLLASGQDTKNIRNVLAGQPMQNVAVRSSPPAYLEEEDTAQPARTGGAGTGATPMASPYSALQNAQLDSLMGTNPTLARAMNLAKLRQTEAEAETAEGGTPFGQEAAKNRAMADLMSGRTETEKMGAGDIANKVERAKTVAEAGTFFQPDVAMQRMITTDAATQAKNLQYVVPAAIKKQGATDVAGIVGQMNLKRAEINAYVSQFKTLMDAKARDATATQLSQDERDRAQKDYDSLSNMVKAFQSARAVDDQQ